MNNTPTRTATRDTQKYAASYSLHDIAAGLSAMSKRLCLLESHIAARTASERQACSSTETKEITLLTAPLRGSTGKDTSIRSAFWYETATTLSTENATLCDKLTKCETKCKDLTENIARLSRIRAALENDLRSASKEIMTLTTQPGATVGAAPFIIPHTKQRSVPAGTQGKDTMHWYQTCRTMETQYIEKIAELETKIRQLTTALPRAKRHKDS